MTGTAETEAPELASIYALEVISIPTNRPLARLDEGDLVYKTEEGKFIAVIRDVAERNENGQPVSNGNGLNRTIGASFQSTHQAGIKHEVLERQASHQGGRNHRPAGRPGAVTVATNMAGRGVTSCSEATRRAWRRWS